MAKIVLNDIVSLANSSSAKDTLNQNFSAIEVEFENTLSRDGSLPNAMLADLDMGDHKVLNVKDPVADADAVNLRSIGPLVNQYVGQIAETIVEGTARVDRFIALAGQTEFVLTDSPGFEENVLVFDTGIVMSPGIDFNLSGPNMDVLTFGSGRAEGAEIIARYIQLSPAEGLLRADLNNPAATKGGQLVSWKQPETGGVTQTVLQELKRTVRVEHFGAVGDGVTDDSGAIQAALDAVYARGGGTVLLDAKEYALLSKLSVKSGCALVGKGAGQYPASAFAESANFIATPKTRLIAMLGFPAATPVVDVNVTRGDQYALHGVRVEGFMIDCAVRADIGLRWRGVKNSTIKDIMVYRPTTLATSKGVWFDTAQGGPINAQPAAAGGASTITFQTALASPRDDWFNGATITTVGGTGSGQVRTVSDYNGTTKVATVTPAWSVVPDATTTFLISGEVLEGNGATQFNIIDQLTIWLGTTGDATGAEWNGDGVHDVNQNSYRNLRIIHANGPGMRMYNGDTDWFTNVSTFAFGIGWGLEMHGSNTTGYEGYCRQEFFNGCLFGGANAGGIVGTAVSGAGLTITLEASASSVNDFYNGHFIDIAGGTGIGQRRKVLDYTGATRIALVDAWTTPPDATSIYDINNGGGVVMYAGTYRTSRWHTFNDYEMEGNGAGEIIAEAGGGYLRKSERDLDYTDVDGFEMSMGSGNAFAGGTQSRLLFKSNLLGRPQEMASIRGFDSGTETAANGSMIFYTRKSGAVPTETFRVSDGISLNEGPVVKRLLRATAALDFPSIAAQNSQSLTVTVTGAQVNDIVMLGPPTGAFSGGLALKGYVSAVNTVTITALNVTSGAIDPSSASIAVVVMGF